MGLQIGTLYLAKDFFFESRSHYVAQPVLKTWDSSTILLGVRITSVRPPCLAERRLLKKLSEFYHVIKTECRQMDTRAVKEVRKLVFS